jgi:hypothetical protein
MLFHVTLSKKRQYMGTTFSVRWSIRQKNLAITLRKFSIFLYQTFKLCCLLQHGYDAKIFRSRSNLIELCPFSYLDFYSDKEPEGDTSVHLNSHLLWFHYILRWFNFHVFRAKGCARNQTLAKINDII